MLTSKVIMQIISIPTRTLALRFVAYLVARKTRKSVARIELTAGFDQSQKYLKLRSILHSKKDQKQISHLPDS